MLVVLISALSASTYEVIDSHDEIDELRAEYVIEIHPVVPEPIEHKEYNHSQLIQQIRTLQNEVRTLREKH